MTMRAGPYIRSRIDAEFALAKQLRRDARNHQIEADRCRQGANAAEGRAVDLAAGTDYAGRGGIGENH